MPTLATSIATLSAPTHPCINATQPAITAHPTFTSSIFIHNFSQVSSEGLPYTSAKIIDVFLHEPSGFWTETCKGKPPPPTSTHFLPVTLIGVWPLPLTTYTKICGSMPPSTTTIPKNKTSLSLAKPSPVYPHTVTPTLPNASYASTGATSLIVAILSPDVPYVLDHTSPPSTNLWQHVANLCTLLHALTHIYMPIAARPKVLTPQLVSSLFTIMIMCGVRLIPITLTLLPNNYLYVSFALLLFILSY